MPGGEARWQGQAAGCRRQDGLGRQGVSPTCPRCLGKGRAELEPLAFRGPCTWRNTCSCWQVLAWSWGRGLAWLAPPTLLQPGRGCDAAGQHGLPPPQGQGWWLSSFASVVHQHALLALLGSGHSWGHHCQEPMLFPGTPRPGRSGGREPSLAWGSSSLLGWERGRAQEPGEQRVNETSLWFSVCLWQRLSPSTLSPNETIHFTSLRL